VKVLVGCSGRAGLSWERYSEAFDIIEVQETFYRMPRPSTLARWRSRAPALGFALKAFQGITHPLSSPTWRRAGRQRPSARPEAYGHLKPTDEVFSLWERICELVRAVGARSVLLQLPPSFDRSQENLENMKSFLGSIERPVPLALELRHASWFSDLRWLGSLLADLSVTHVVDPLAMGPAHIQGIAYYRLHGLGWPGPRLIYRHEYTEQELRRGLELIAAYGGEEAFVFFNNTNMKEDAAKFKGLLMALPSSPPA
jgi:uncharacterized protein YecE (DUF72 family)